LCWMIRLLEASVAFAMHRKAPHRGAFYWITFRMDDRQ
jgi:hypothetical protein